MCRGAARDEVVAKWATEANAEPEEHPPVMRQLRPIPLFLLHVNELAVRQPEMALPLSEKPTRNGGSNRAFEFSLPRRHRMMKEFAMTPLRTQKI